ncbi:MAG: preprotein translocase subunit SecE [Flavobacteriaceae bacterium]|nr:preprotein translocase subunit SecE [Flavobacteriaceae bacterium]
MMGFVNYIKESFGELKDNVTWMPRDQAQKNTVLVAVFTIIFAVAVFLVDKVFQMGLDKYFNIFN